MPTTKEDLKLVDILPRLKSGEDVKGVASIQAGRKFIGIEKEEKYCELAAKRIEDTENKVV